MTLLKFLGWRGIAGLVVAALLAIMLLGAKSEARHWKKQSGQWETKYDGEHMAFGLTVLNYRAAAEKARKDDAANKARVEAEQTAINERTAHDFETRLADARARAAAGRLQSAQGATHSSGSRGPAVPGVQAPTSGAAQAAGQSGLPADDALTATEQAIQLDELVKWVKRQADINPNK